jgi:hypothetical protein
MGELVVPEADNHIRPAAHAGMHSTMPKEQAENRIMRICSHAADGIAGIDVLDT